MAAETGAAQFHGKAVAALGRSAGRYRELLAKASGEPLPAADLLWKRSRHDAALKEDLIRAACLLLASALTVEAVAGIRAPERRGNQYAPLNQDAEVAAFVRSKLGTMGVRQIAQLCRDQFGPERAPGKSAIGRYWQRLRGSGEPP